MLGPATELSAVLALAVALLIPALFNGYPLIFPDSAAYLRIGYQAYFGVERASGYGLFLKPWLSIGAGPWVALVGQVLFVATVTWSATRTLLSASQTAAAMLVMVGLSAWPWHASQLMPDAFTAPLVLLAWLLVAKRLGTFGTVATGVAVVLLLTMHYTHLALFAVATVAAIIFGRSSGESPRGLMARGGFSLSLLTVGTLVQLGANVHYLHRASVTPGGPVFLFARLNEDGLMSPWLKRHCGEPRIAKLCLIAPYLPRRSQELLWNKDTPLARTIWQEGPAGIDRWGLVDEMGIADRGAIMSAPIKFAAASLRGAGRQFIHFQALDDECPVHCGEPGREIWTTLSQLDPRGFAAFRNSAQATTGLPVSAVRMLTTPVTALALLALVPALILARRRDDKQLAGLAAAVLFSLAANAALAGAFSDVHDRYQSRLAYLAILVGVVAVVRLGVSSKLGRRVLNTTVER